MDLQPGLLITPSIRLAHLLGRGGMGSVWVAEHLRLRVRVVVKFIAAEHVDDPSAVARFEREAAAAASAKSPHVVQILDYGLTTFGMPFIAMEFLEGEDLGKRLSRDRRISPVIFAEWLVQACKGLTRIHACGVVHRDIKPENIYLCNVDGEVFVKLLDFGIAKADALSMAGAGTHTQAFIGTVHYMSPEQTMGAKLVDHRTDLWALAVVTYRALTGVRPFDGEAIGALIESIRTLPIKPPSSHLAELGPSIDAWMERALARDPDKRFGSAREMAQAYVQAINALGHTSVRYFSDPAPKVEVQQHASIPAPPAPPPVQPGAHGHAAFAGSLETTPPSSITLRSLGRESPEARLAATHRPDPRVPRSLLVGAGLGVVLAIVGTYAWSTLRDRDANSPTSNSSDPVLSVSAVETRRPAPSTPPRPTPSTDPPIPAPETSHAPIVHPPSGVPTAPDTPRPPQVVAAPSASVRVTPPIRPITRPRTDPGSPGTSRPTTPTRESVPGVPTRPLHTDDELR